jgi:hypothetical protein
MDMHIVLLNAILERVGGDSPNLMGILLRLLVSDVLKLVLCNMVFRLPVS